MKALVLAAGLGTRLRPYSDVIPKPLFPVLGIPTIKWVLAGLRQAGVTQVVVNLHHLPEAIVAAVGEGSGSGVSVGYSRESRILGTGGALVGARARLDDDGPFLVHNADIFHDWDLRRMADGPAPALAVTDGPDLPESDRRVELGASGRVVALRGLPSAGNGRRVVYGGVARVDGDVVDRLAAAMPGFPGTLSPACLVADALIPMLSAGLDVGAVEYSSMWYCDTGTPESYLDLNFRALAAAGELTARLGFPVPREVEPGVFLGAGARIGRGVRLLAPVMVCDGAVVEDRAVVGPMAVVSGHVGREAVVSGAVVMAGARAHGIARGIFVPGEARIA